MPSISVIITATKIQDYNIKKIKHTFNNEGGINN